MRALVLVLALLTPWTASGRERLKARFLLDAAPGLTVPIGDADYDRLFDPTFKFSLRIGAELWPTKLIGVAPEVVLDGIPMNANDAVFQPVTFAGVDASFGRFRAVFGARLLINFGIGAVFLRFGVGVDYLGGSVRANLTGQPIGNAINQSSTGFTADPAIGVQFGFLRYGVAGAQLGFPVALHDFDGSGNQRGFVAADLDILGFVGVRI